LISVAGPAVECYNVTVTSLTIEWSDISSDITFWTIKLFRETQLIKVCTKDITNVVLTLIQT